MTRLTAPKAPNLLIAPTQYTAGYHEQMNNALRLYFNRVDAGNSALYGTLGGQFLNFPHVSASNSTDEYALGDDTPTIITWDTLGEFAGFTLNADNTATAPVSGKYKIDYSLQFANNDSSQHEAYVWLRVDGVDVPNSCSLFSLQTRRSDAIDSYLVAYSSVLFKMLGGQKISLHWATDKAAVSGGALGVYLESVPAQTTPYPRPANPSACGSITFVSCPCDQNIL
jgi:hypothetical protein